MSRASTWGGKLDASGGYIGNCDCTALERSLKFRVARADFAAPGKPNAPDKQKNGQDAAEADNPENGSAIGGARGVIVITKQQDVVDGRTDLPRGSVDESQAHVAAGILDAIEVTGDAAVGGQNHHAPGVREKVGFRVKAEPKIRGAGSGFDGLHRTAEEMPP